MNAATSSSSSGSSSSGYAASAASSRCKYAYLKDVGADVDSDLMVVDVATRPEESTKAAICKRRMEEAAKLISTAMPALTIRSNNQHSSSLSATATATATVTASASASTSATATAAATGGVNAHNECMHTQRILINTREFNQINLKSSQSFDQVTNNNNNNNNNKNNSNNNETHNINNNKNHNSNHIDNNSSNRKSQIHSKKITSTTATDTATNPARATIMPTTMRTITSTAMTTTILRKSFSTPASFKIDDVACDTNNDKGGGGTAEDAGGGGGGGGVVDCAAVGAAIAADISADQSKRQQQQQVALRTIATTTTTPTTTKTIAKTTPTNAKPIGTTIDGVTRSHLSVKPSAQSPTASQSPPQLSQQQQQQKQQQQQQKAEKFAASTAVDTLDSSVEDVPAVMFDVDQRFGCAHYKRRAMFVTPCCNKFYKCRFCHDENESHHFDRKTLTELICSECNTRQKVQEQCENCGTRFGKYTCLICNLFDDTDKKQYHCKGCGICRIGGAENFFHCEVCDMCLPIRLKIDGHRCVENISRSHCPVCLGDIHTSRIPCHIPDCGHLLHKTCFDQLLNSGHYACPICQTSLIDMTALWEYLDAQAVSLPIPKKYENQRIHIFCNDCHKTSKTKFNFIGLKCMQCGAYNTTQDVKRRMSLVTDEPSSA